MASQLLIGGAPYFVIGGTTAYIQLSITVPVTANGVVTNTPIAYGDATITAKAYVGNGDIEAATVSDGGNGLILVKLSSVSTANLSQLQGTTNASLDVSAVLKSSIANTSYQAGDTLGYRWFFFVEAKMHA